MGTFYMMLRKKAGIKFSFLRDEGTVLLSSLLKTDKIRLVINSSSKIERSERYATTQADIE